MTGRLTVDLNALAQNYRTLAALDQGPCSAVIKADAYGLGMPPVARRLWSVGCRHFFVAFVEEGVQLRRELPDAEIFVLEGVHPDALQAMRAYRLTPVLNTVGQCDLWSDGDLPAALHIDTGMTRLGLPVETDPGSLPRLNLKYLMTHLARADEFSNFHTQAQVDAFSSAFARFQVAYPEIGLSINNSAALLSTDLGTPLPVALHRPGIALYGSHPGPISEGGDNCLQTVALLEGRVLQVREVEAGTAVGYGGTYVTQCPARLATINVGYADGVPRLLSNVGGVFAQQRRLPIVGRVSMDSIQVEIGTLELSEGDWVEIFGPNVPIDEVAAQCQTISYEVLTGLGQRLERTYLGDGA